MNRKLLPLFFLCGLGLVFSLSGMICLLNAAPAKSVSSSQAVPSKNDGVDNKQVTVQQQQDQQFVKDPSSKEDSSVVGEQAFAPTPQKIQLLTTASCSTPAGDKQAQEKKDDEQGSSDDEGNPWQKQLQDQKVFEDATADLEESQKQKGSLKEQKEQEKEGEDRAKKIDLPAPVGQMMEGITIPQYHEDGQLGINFMVKKAQKSAQHQVEMEGLRIVFLQQGNRNITIMVPKATFDLKNKILRGEKEISIKREDFSLIGTDSTFDTVKRLGTVKGPIHAEFRNQQQINF